MDVIATQQIAGNNSGPYLRRPKIVVMHATRSGQGWTDAEELGATLNWFVNPNGASAHWVLSEKERVRVVADDLIAWHSAYLNGRSWGVELTQPTIDRPFADGHYDNAALVGKHYVSLGVAPVWLDYWDGDVMASGFVHHADTKQGRESGKSDAGPEFDTVRFIASLEPAPPEPEPEPTPKPTPAPEPKEENMIIVIIRAENSKTQYALLPDARKYRLGSLEHRNALNRLVDMGAIRIEYRVLPAADVAAIPDEHA